MNGEAFLSGRSFGIREVETFNFELLFFKFHKKVPKCNHRSFGCDWRKVRADLRSG